MDIQPLDNKYRTLAHRCQVQLSKKISIRSPASAEVDVKDNLRNGFSSFEVGAEFIYSSLETKNKLTQASAKLVSLLDQGIYLKWNQHWNEFLVSHLKVNSQTITITEANSVTIQDRKQQKGGIEMGISLIQNRSQVDFNLGYQDRILQRYISPLVVRLEVVPAPYAEVNFKQTLTNGRPLMLGLFAGAGAVFPNAAGVYDDQGSFYYQGGFFVGHQELNSGLVTSFQYKTNSFNSNEYLKNRLNEIKLDISYRWLWGL